MLCEDRFQDFAVNASGQVLDAFDTPIAQYVIRAETCHGAAKLFGAMRLLPMQCLLPLQPSTLQRLERCIALPRAKMMLVDNLVLPDIDSVAPRFIVLDMLQRALLTARESEKSLLLVRLPEKPEHALARVLVALLDDLGPTIGWKISVAESGRRAYFFVFDTSGAAIASLGSLGADDVTPDGSQRASRAWVSQRCQQSGSDYGSAQERHAVTMEINRKMGHYAGKTIQLIDAVERGDAKEARRCLELLPLDDVEQL